MRVSLPRLVTTAALALAATACTNASRPGETGELNMAFGSGAATVSTLDRVLAAGGRTALALTDDKRRFSTLTVASSAKDVVVVSTPTVKLEAKCTDANCGYKTYSEIWLTAVGPGEARISLVDAATDGLFDALTVTVAPATKLELREPGKAATSPLTVAQGGSVSLEAVPLDAQGRELVADETFAFRASGAVTVSRATTDRGPLLNVQAPAEAPVGGEGTVVATFGTLQQTLRMAVGAPPAP